MPSKSQLDLIANLFQTSSMTSKTLKIKDYQWSIFTSFCKLYHEEPIPASGDTLVRFSTYLIVQRNCSIPVVKNYLSTIRRYHKLFLNVDIPSPTQYLPLQFTLRGGAKYLGRNVQQKYPVTANMLAALTMTLPDTSPFKTLYNLLFFGLPRVGNILPDSKATFSTIRHLTWRKVFMCNDGVIITLPVTKTIQCFERELRIPISSSPDRPQFCVLAGLNAMRQLPGYPTGLDQPVFNLYNGGTWAPLSRKDLVNMMSTQLNYLGLDARMITPSGFRKGGMSHMLLCTGNLELLRLQGDWRSDAYKRYIVIPAELRFPVTQNAMIFMP